MIADLVSYLNGQAAISVLVASRIYPLNLPQNPTLPALSYAQISAVRTYDLIRDLRKSRTHMQIDCWASTAKAAHELATAVRHALSGFYGSMAGTQVHLIRIDNERDWFEDPAGVTGLFRVTQDHIISHLED